jgi:hypothetical protein
MDGLNCQGFVPYGRTKYGPRVVTLDPQHDQQHGYDNACSGESDSQVTECLRHRRPVYRHHANLRCADGVNALPIRQAPTQRLSIRDIRVIRGQKKPRQTPPQLFFARPIIVVESPPANCYSPRTPHRALLALSLSKGRALFGILETLVTSWSSSDSSASARGAHR